MTGKKEKQIVPSGRYLLEQVKLGLGLYFPFLFCLKAYYENFQIYSKVYRIV